MSVAERVDPRRVRCLKKARWGKGPVLYWMSRDQRIRDNWALLYAQDLASREERSLAVCFCVAPAFLGAGRRQYGFMFKGLRELLPVLEKKGIGFQLLMGDPGEKVARWADETDAGCVVTDFDPLRVKREWKGRAVNSVSCPFYEVDAHNIVPCWVASEKQEYAARTIRPKIQKLLPEFLTSFPGLKKHPVPWPSKSSSPDWDKAEASLDMDDSVPEVSWIKPGQTAARRAAGRFCEQGLWDYDDARNDPTVEGQSDLSPYLHFGQLSAQRVALLAKKSQAPRQSREAFLEELIVRRELSDNYCFYNEQYDSVKGFPAWANHTLSLHANDTRDPIYTLQALEEGDTHDPLWNAAQRQMVTRGKMHGYLRMYWAKKILEWMPSVEEAFPAAIHLNDKYELDGRDPNGFVGVAWSMGGVHDRPWGERSVFGTVRYMSFAGCERKFDVDGYVDKWGG